MWYIIIIMSSERVHSFYITPGSNFNGTNGISPVLQMSDFHVYVWLLDTFVISYYQTYVYGDSNIGSWLKLQNMR